MSQQQALTKQQLVELSVQAGRAHHASAERFLRALADGAAEISATSMTAIATGTVVPRSLADRFADAVNVLDHTREDELPNITNGMNRAANHIRSAGHSGTIVIPSGSFTLTGSVNLTFSASDFSGGINVCGSGKGSTNIYVNMNEEFPALDCTGNSYAALSGFTLQHDIACASSCSIQGAKPDGGGGKGQQLHLIGVIVDRQSNSTNHAPCVIVSNADLPVFDKCVFYGRAGINIGMIATGVAKSKFQTISSVDDFTAAWLKDCVINSTDYCARVDGGSGITVNIAGGYYAMIGSDVLPINGKKATIHVLNEARLIVSGLRTENQTSSPVALDGVLALHGNSSESIVEINIGSDDPAIWVGGNVTNLTANIRSEYTTAAVFDGNGNIFGANVVTNRPTLSSGSVSSERVSLAGEYMTAPTGAQSAPGLRVGGQGIGFYSASRSDQLAGSSALGLSLDGVPFQWYRRTSSQISYGPGPAASSTSDGYIFRIAGGLSGTTSGASGGVIITTILPVSGSSGNISINTGSGAGTNSASGGISVLAGAATGTGNGGAITIKAGASNSGIGGNLTVGGGDSSGNQPGSTYIDSGIGDNGNTVIALRNRANGNIQFQVAGANRWSIDATGGAGRLRPEQDASIDLGSPSFRINNSYFAVSPTVSSDERGKTSISTINGDAALNFISDLRPVSFLLRNGGAEITGYEEKEISYETEDGEGNNITRTGTTKVPVEVRRPGRRRHVGLIAQEVRAALQEHFPADDLALWGLADPADPQSLQHLRYEQAIPFLIAAVDRLRQRVADLERSNEP